MATLALFRLLLSGTNSAMSTYSRSRIYLANFGGMNKLDAQDDWMTEVMATVVVVATDVGLEVGSVVVDALNVGNHPKMEAGGVSAPVILITAEVTICTALQLLSWQACHYPYSYATPLS